MNMMETFVFVSIGRENAKLLASRQIIACGLSGIAAIELLKAGKLKWDGKKLEAGGESSIRDSMLDEVRKLAIKRKTSRNPKMFITAVSSGVRHFTWRVLKRLEDGGMIRIDQYRFLGLIPYSRYVVSRVSRHEKLLRDLKEILLDGNKNVDADNAFLITLLFECGVLDRLFSKDERKRLDETFRQIGKGKFFENLGDAMLAICKATREAVMAAKAASS